MLMNFDRVNGEIFTAGSVEKVQRCVVAGNHGTNIVVHVSYAWLVSLQSDVFTRKSVTPTLPDSPSITSPEFFNKPSES